MSREDDVPEVDRLDGAPHPRDARELFGHEGQEHALLDAYRSGRMPQALILGGDEGIGKATFAYRAARFLLAHPDPASSAVAQAADLSVPPDHPAARRISAQAHGGLFVLRRRWIADKKRMPTEIPIDMVRDAIGFFGTTAAEGGWRVCIIDSAEDLNRNSANALLKVLEEPPARSLFLIVSHVPGRLLPTIRSRARLMAFRPLTEEQVLLALRSAAPSGADETLMRRAAALSRGSVRQAFKVLDEGTLAIVEHIRAALARLPAIDWSDIHAIAEGLAGRPNEAAFETMVETVFDWLGEQAQERAGEGARRLAPLAEVWDKVARLVRETDSYNLDRRALVLTLFTELSEALRASRAA